MNQSYNPILIGIIAGLATALLMAASGYAPFASLFLLSASLGAIFLAGLGSGLVASLVAIAVAAIANALLYSSPESLVFTAVPLLPASVMAYLANLARPAEEIGGPDSATAWFPLSDILLIGAVLTAIATVITISVHADMEKIYEAVAEAAIRMAQDMSPEMPIAADMQAQMKGILKSLWPLIQSAQMMVALFAGYYMASRILSATGRNMRPREDMPTSLRMNRVSILVFLLGLALMFAGGPIGLAGSSFAGATAAGFLLAGFAIIHRFLREKPWGTPTLIIIYLLTLLMPIFGIAIILAGGLANPRRAIALTPNKAPTANDN